MTDRTDLSSTDDEGRKLIAAIIRAAGTPITVPVDYLTDAKGHVRETVQGREVTYEWLGDVPDGNGSDE